MDFKDYQTKTQIRTFHIWEDFLIPIELKSIKYLELHKYNEKRSIQEALELVKQRARKQIIFKLPDYYEIIDERIRYIESEEQRNLVRVQVVLEVLEDIA